MEDKNRHMEENEALEAAQNKGPKPGQPLESDDFNANDWDENVDTDKYLAMEQPGVTYTTESKATMNSDFENAEDTEGTYDASGANSRNADAFSQDDYILRDNIDLDEDQNQSISSEDNDK